MTEPKLLKPFDLDAFLLTMGRLLQDRPEGYMLNFADGQSFKIDKFSYQTFPQMIKDSGFVIYTDEKGQLHLVEEVDVSNPEDMIEH